jgi:hypothetical protein
MVIGSYGRLYYGVTVLKLDPTIRSGATSHVAELLGFGRAR